MQPGLSSPQQIVDHLFRHESGKMIAVLTRIFGMHNLSLAEDVVQEAFLKAVQTWAFTKVPFCLADDSGPQQGAGYYPPPTTFQQPFR